MKFRIKIVKKRPGRALERRPRDQMSPGQAQKRQDDENHGSGTPLGTLHGASFEGPTRSRSVAEGVLTKSQMRIARKSDF